MFLRFFGLQEQPFGVTPDSRFLFLGRTHRADTLTHGIERGDNFMALVAPAGMGKTALLNQVLSSLPATRTALLFDTHGLATIGTPEALSILLRLSHYGVTRTQRAHAGEVLARAGLYTPQERIHRVRALIELASRHDTDSETIRQHFAALREITNVNLPDEARLAPVASTGGLGQHRCPHPLMIPNA